MLSSRRHLAEEAGMKLRLWMARILLLGLAAALLAACAGLPALTAPPDLPLEDRGGGVGAATAVPAVDLSAAAPELRPLLTELQAQGGVASLDPAQALGDQAERSATYKLSNQAGTPVSLPNFVHPEYGCNWTGVGGQVFNAAGEPLPSLVIQVTGMLEERDLLLLALTGTTPVLGPGGYLITLADHPVATAAPLYMQVFNLQGIAQTGVVAFTTAADCNQNLTLLNFAEVLLDRFYFMPTVPLIR
jgi:hypothetical protein